MKKFQWALSGVLLCQCLMLGGCVSSGNPSIVDQTLVDQIKLDISTKEDVRRILGQPNSMSRSSTSNSQFPGVPLPATLTNFEAWSYSHTDIAVDGATFIPIVGLFAGGATASINTFMVMFDDKGVVRHITYSQSQGQSGMKREGPTNQYVK
jgi:hypothetical protein